MSRDLSSASGLGHLVDYTTGLSPATFIAVHIQSVAIWSKALRRNAKQSGYNPYCILVAAAAVLELERCVRDVIRSLCG